MFELVIDVLSYPEFLPWCSATRLLSMDETELCGELEVFRASVHQRFSTINRLYPFERIDLSLREGPLKSSMAAGVLHRLVRRPARWS